MPLKYFTFNKTKSGSPLCKAKKKEFTTKNPESAF